MKKLQGGQPLTWMKTIKRDLHSIDLTLNKASKTAQDRDKMLPTNCDQRNGQGRINNLTSRGLAMSGRRGQL